MMPRFYVESLEKTKNTEAEKQLNAQKALSRYIHQNIQYPKIAKENGIEGLVVVSFVVEKDGSISNAKFLKDIGGGCGAEAVRVVETLNTMTDKPFVAGKNEKNEKKRVQYNLPIRFRRENEVEKSELINQNPKLETIKQLQEKIAVLKKRQNWWKLSPQNNWKNINNPDQLFDICQKYKKLTAKNKALHIPGDEDIHLAGKISGQGLFKVYTPTYSKEELKLNSTKKFIENEIIKSTEFIKYLNEKITQLRSDKPSIPLTPLEQKTLTEAKNQYRENRSVMTEELCFQLRSLETYDKSLEKMLSNQIQRAANLNSVNIDALDDLDLNFSYERFGENGEGLEYKFDIEDHDNYLEAVAHIYLVAMADRGHQLGMKRRKYVDVKANYKYDVTVTVTGPNETEARDQAQKFINHLKNGTSVKAAQKYYHKNERSRLGLSNTNNTYRIVYQRANTQVPTLQISIKAPKMLAAEYKNKAKKAAKIKALKKLLFDSE